MAWENSGSRWSKPKDRLSLVKPAPHAPLPPRECDLEDCLETFTPRRPQDRFHSDACRVEWYRRRSAAQKRSRNASGREAQVTEVIVSELRAKGWTSHPEWEIRYKISESGERIYDPRYPLRVDLAAWRPGQHGSDSPPALLIEIKYNNGWTAIGQALRYGLRSGIPVVVASARDEWDEVAALMSRTGLGYWRVDLDARTVTRLV